MILFHFRFLFAYGAASEDGLSRGFVCCLAVFEARLRGPSSALRSSHLVVFGVRWRALPASFLGSRFRIVGAFGFFVQPGHSVPLILGDDEKRREPQAVEDPLQAMRSVPRSVLLM